MNDSIHKRWIAIGLLFLVIIFLSLSIIYPLFLSWIDSYEQKSELVFK